MQQNTRKFLMQYNKNYIYIDIQIVYNMLGTYKYILVT